MQAGLVAGRVESQHGQIFVVLKKPSGANESYFKNYGLFCDCMVIEYLIVNGEDHDPEENRQSP
jgi:hypothetical protein